MLRLCRFWTTDPDIFHCRETERFGPDRRIKRPGLRLTLTPYRTSF